MQLFEMQGGTQPPKSEFRYEPTDGYIRLLQIRDFGEKPVPTYVRQKATLKTCKANDVLVGRYGASVGRICTGMEGAYNVALTKVVIPNEVDRRFVYFLLNSDAFQSPLLDIERSAQDGFNKEDLEEIELPLPPLAEQRRIVAKLEGLLTKVSTTQQRLSRVPGLLKRFRQSVLAAACSGKLTADWREENPKDNAVEPTIERLCETPLEWQWVTLNTLCDLNRGICYGVIKLGSAEKDGVPCLRTSDVKPLRIDADNVKRISAVISNEFQRSILQSGEVLVNVRGTLGGVAVVPKAMRGWNVSREVAVVPTQNVSPQFIANWIATQTAQNWLQGVAKGVAYTGINLEDLRLLPVPIPSLPEQHEIVRRVEKLFAFADQIESRLKQAQAQVDRLTQSLLAKAFRGELVPTEAEFARQQGRPYESANELLARIRSTKPTTTKRTRSKAGKE
jgi:type I restriction enzyme S subunit